MNILIQARSNSERFPNKIYRIVKGKPLLFHSIDIAAKSEARYFVGIPFNDFKLEDYLIHNKIPFFKGSETDVLDRFYQFAKTLKTDFFVRMCGDTIYNEEDFWDMINLYKKRKRFTYGQGYWIFNFRELEEAWQKTDYFSQREHLCNFMMPCIDYEEDLTRKKL